MKRNSKSSIKGESLIYLEIPSRLKRTLHKMFLKKIKKLKLLKARDLRRSKNLEDILNSNQKE